MTQLVEREDGRVLWEGLIAVPMEMLPWIRGWGADVEVLAPEWLREAQVEEARELGNVYGCGTRA